MGSVSDPFILLKKKYYVYLYSIMMVLVQSGNIDWRII